MKIALSYGFFLPVPPARGGATEKIWHALGRRLASRGHDITAFTRSWPGWPDREVIDGVRYHRLPGRDHTSRLWRNLLLDFCWSLRVRRSLTPDQIVISHNISLPWLLTRLPRRHPSPVSVVIGRMPKGQVRTYGKVDRIYATSEAVAARCLRENPAVAPRLRTLRNSIDWHALQGPGPAPGTPLHIGYVGRLHPEKGLDMLIDAGARLAARPDLPSWKISLVGPVRITDGGGGEDFAASLVARAAAAGIANRFEITPPIFDAAKLADFYRTLSVFVYPTRAEQGEGLSVAPIEAMAAGAVPVLSALPCYTDLLTPERDGLLFDHRSPRACEILADTLGNLLTAPARRTSLAEAARATARRFDYDAVAAELETDLASLLSRR
ncbi:MAG: glycosyltransferase family 4 protein [Opitutaceae bacterium]|jgi:glycosyltransferase involved in cell wall biosynthesis|nr:glycosyltransferase family 4 protein [Opitutaceae bacterium]